MDMFKEWGFLLGEIWVLIALALLLGVLAGWLIWGRGDKVVQAGPSDELVRLSADLATCSARLSDCKAAGARAAMRIAELEQAGDREQAAPAPLAAATAVQPAPAPAMQRPQALDSPRNGRSDDLKLIKGIGPQMEKLCNALGFFHFDQIAAWTEAEIAWVDENLEGFKGRVTRDEWVSQARVLADGGPPRPMASKPF
jgi:predicted flap endonuclease-1-like 5' DNA nuclease